MIQIYITHYVTPDTQEINGFLEEAVHYLERHTLVEHQTNVVYWHPPGADYLYSELRHYLPKSTRFILSERQPRPDILPALRNTAVLDARAMGSDTIMVLLENDIRVTHGWLHSLVNDLERVERRTGASCIVHPRYAPYVMSRDRLHEWTKIHGVPVVKAGDGMAILSLESDPVEDNQALMMFITRAGVFDKFGLCDESFVDWGYDDDDWAMRAVLAGVKNYQSQGAWIHHLVGLTFHHPGRKIPHKPNLPVFIKKWYGTDDWEAVLEYERPPQLWRRIHAGQVEDPGGPFYELAEVAAGGPNDF